MFGRRCYTRGSGCFILTALLVTGGTTNGAHAAIFGDDSRRPVHALEPNNPYLALARPIGQLVTRYENNRRGLCTAAVITPTLILTAAYCVDPMSVTPTSRIAGEPGGVLSSATLQLGLVNPVVPLNEYVVNPKPVDLNRELGFALLEVEGNPAKDFGRAKLRIRRPQPHEKLALFQATPTKSGRSWLNVADDCSVQERPMTGGTFAHDCDTERGSGGALMFTYSEADDEYFVLGLHSNSSSEIEPFNLARSMRDIAAASPILSQIALIRPDPVVTGPDKRFSISMAGGDIPADIRADSVVKLNGKDRIVASVDPAQGTITFLGEDDILQQGLNLFESNAREFKFWREQQVLMAYEEPYKKSYAIIAAIDDYERTKEPELGKSGLPQLKGMVARAEELKSLLVGSGFSETNIFTLYDEKAKKGAIEELLAEFWQGGKYTDADRVLFYFGGHGAGEEGGGYLVTYDFDPVRPTWTGLLMSDFTSRQFPNIRAKHLLVALDSCSSGLALPEMLAGGISDEQFRKFKGLSAIRGDTEEMSRNIMVAGRGEQKALAETGGIFTQALIAGLQSAADGNSDGIVQLEELSFYIESEVRTRADAAQVRQNPGKFVATKYGSGKVLFLLPGRR